MAGLPFESYRADSKKLKCRTLKLLILAQLISFPFRFLPTRISYSVSPERIQRDTKYELRHSLAAWKIASVALTTAGTERQRNVIILRHLFDCWRTL